MKANAIQGKRESIETEYVLHILGLSVCADTLVIFCPFLHLSVEQKKFSAGMVMLSSPMIGV